METPGRPSSLNRIPPVAGPISILTGPSVPLSARTRATPASTEARILRAPSLSGGKVSGV